MRYVLLTFPAILFFLISCEGRRRPLGEAYAREQLREALMDSAQTFFDRPLVSDEEGAVKYAETILFGIYGKDKIREERPYEIHFIDEYWVVKGTLPEGYDGGTFLIIFSSMNGRVVRLIHTR